MLHRWHWVNVGKNWEHLYQNVPFDTV